jgi:hypothetical protein
MARSAFLGAGIAIALAATLVVLGGGSKKPLASNAVPAPSQAPAPALDPVTKATEFSPSASPEAPSQATSSHKETK